MFFFFLVKKYLESFDNISFMCYYNYCKNGNAHCKESND